jgi:hypothetical protein
MGIKWFNPRSKVYSAEETAHIQRYLARVDEQAQRQKELESLPPETHVTRCLEEAGLPGDPKQVVDRHCLFSVHRLSKEGSISYLLDANQIVGKVRSIEVNAYTNLYLRLEGLSKDFLPRIQYKDKKWIASEYQSFERNYRDRELDFKLL